MQQAFGGPNAGFPGADGVRDDDDMMGLVRTGGQSVVGPAVPRFGGELFSSSPAKVVQPWEADRRRRQYYGPVKGGSGVDLGPWKDEGDDGGAGVGVGMGDGAMGGLSKNVALAPAKKEKVDELKAVSEEDVEMGGADIRGGAVDGQRNMAAPLVKQKESEMEMDLDAEEDGETGGVDIRNGASDGLDVGSMDRIKINLKGLLGGGRRL